MVITTSTIVMAANVCLKNNIMKIGGEYIAFENDIYTINEKTYIPIRELSEKLRIPIRWDGEKDQVELLTDFKTVRTSEGTPSNEAGVIPDEETAYKIGKIILEKYVGKSLEYETEKGVYYLKTTYHQLDNSWRISQECKYKQGGGGGTGIYSPTVVLNRNTGEVTFISTVSVFED